MKCKTDVPSLPNTINIKVSSLNYMYSGTPNSSGDKDLMYFTQLNDIIILIAYL